MAAAADDFQEAMGMRATKWKSIRFLVNLFFSSKSRYFLKNAQTCICIDNEKIPIHGCPAVWFGSRLIRLIDICSSLGPGKVPWNEQLVVSELQNRLTTWVKIDTIFKLDRTNWHQLQVNTPCGYQLSQNR